MKNNIVNNLNKLRELMNKHNIDAYIVPTNDFHGSEYVGDYFKTRSFISGFTGSAGTVVVTKTTAGLWADGRYFLQAENELAGSTIDLYKMGEPGVPTILEFLNEQLIDNATIGFDGRVISIDFVESLQNGLNKENLNLFYSLDLIDQIWENRPSISKEKAFELDIKYSGLTRGEKFKQVRVQSL